MRMDFRVLVILHLIYSSPEKKKNPPILVRKIVFCFQAKMMTLEYYRVYMAGKSDCSSRKSRTPAKKISAIRIPGSRLTSGTRSVAAT